MLSLSEIILSLTHVHKHTFSLLGGLVVRFSPRWFEELYLCIVVPDTAYQNSHSAILFCCMLRKKL